MKKITTLIFVSFVLASLFVVPVFAENPNTIEDGFVCPVLEGKAGENAAAKGNGKFVQPDGTYYTIVGPNVRVPRQATNGDNGINSPGGPYDSPGDITYTAIWP
ncbi:hypothetical protein ACFL0D_08920 [Thermoproteota archaeon]